MKKLNLVFGAMVAAAAVTAPAQAQVQITGTTTGCFYTTTVCTSGSNSVSNGGLTFTGTSFNLFANPSNTYSLNLGTLGLSSNYTGSNSFWDGLQFRLFVNFSSPVDAATNPSIWTAELDAEFNGSSFEDIDVNFNNDYRTINYDGNVPNGTLFDIRVNDPSDVDPNTVRTVSGNIRCERGECQTPTSVPEPSSLALVAAGLAGMFGAARRRNRNA